MDDPIEKAIRDALRLLFANDAFLLKTNVAERTIAAQLAEYLRPHFPGHRVDVEYNRHGREPKMLAVPDQYRGGGKKLIYPDVVIHQRGNDDENLLVIQIKKETNHDPRDYDRAVVEGMKRQFRYRRGLLIDLPAGAGAENRKPYLEWP